MDEDLEAKGLAVQAPENFDLTVPNINDGEHPSSGTASFTEATDVKILVDWKDVTHETDGPDHEAIEVHEQKYQGDELPMDEEHIDEESYEEDEGYDEYGNYTSFTKDPGGKVIRGSFWGDEVYVRHEIHWPETRHTIVDTVELLVSLLDTIEGLADKALYMDLEGNDLGRAGSVSIMQLFIDARAQRRVAEREAELAEATKKAAEEEAAEKEAAEAKAEDDEHAKSEREWREIHRQTKSWHMLFLEDELAARKKVDKETNISPPTGGHTYLVDITVLQARAFNILSTSGASTFKSLLEDPSIPKVLWDCRTDSDALYHHYQISLKGVLDLQLIECLGRDDNKRRRISGYSNILGEELSRRSGNESVKAKKAKRYFENNKDYSVFDKRPLSQELIDYCVGDVKYLPFLFINLSNYLVRHDDWPHGPIPRKWRTFTPSDYFSQPATRLEFGKLVKNEPWEIVRQWANRVRLSQLLMWNRESLSREAMTLSPWAMSVMDWQDRYKRENYRIQGWRNLSKEWRERMRSWYGGRIGPERYERLSTLRRLTKGPPTPPESPV